MKTTPKTRCRSKYRCNCKYMKNKSRSTKCRSKNRCNYKYMKNKSRSTRCRRKNRIKSKYLRGGNNLIECAMCNKKNLDKYFIPGKCLQENGYRKAHRICEHCWWNNFAKEGTNHSCPGCDNNIALNNIITIPSNDVEIIELSDDDN